MYRPAIPGERPAPRWGRLDAAFETCPNIWSDLIVLNWLHAEGLTVFEFGAEKLVQRLNAHRASLIERAAA
jgi:hypothetical protein